MTSSTLQKRINKELAELATPPNGISASMRGDNVRQWDAHIVGPADTPYAGGVFALRIELPAEYPFSAPKVYFTTPIMHPNIGHGGPPGVPAAGAICLDILSGKWTPSLTITKVLLSIQLLLSCPYDSSALNADAAKLYRSNRADYDAKVRAHTLKHAMPK